MSKKSKPMVEVAMPMGERKAEARLTFPPKSDLADVMKKVKFGSTVTLEITGQVKAINATEWDHSLTVEIKSVDVDGGMAGDLKALKKKRTQEPDED